MTRLCTLSLSGILLTISLMPAVAQVKLASISGAPGEFDTTTGLAFMAEGDTAFITNPGSGLVQKFRLTTGEVMASLRLDPGVGPVVVSPNRLFLVVLGVATQKLYIIDVASMMVRDEASVPNQDTGFTGINNIIISPDSAKIFIADPSRDVVSVFDSFDGKHDRDMGVGINPNIMSPVPPENKDFGLLCSGRKSGDDESVYFFDTMRLAIIDVQPLVFTDTEPFNNPAFARSSDRLFLFVPVFNENRLAIVDLETNIPASRAMGGAEGPTKGFSSPNGNWLAVVATGTQDVVLFRLPEAIDPTIIDLPEMEFTPDSTLAFSGDSQTLFIPSRNTDEIVTYDLAAEKIRGRIRVGRQPTLLQVDPSGNVLTSIDTGSNELSLVALDPIPVLIPHLTQTEEDYSGVAIANFGLEGANVSFIAKDDSGELLAGTINPRIVTILPNQQISLVLAELFGFDPSETFSGYVEGYSLSSGVTTLYLTGTIDQTQLDGFVADNEVGTILGFSRLTHGVTQFGSVTSTEIILLNPTEEDVLLTLRMFATTLDGPGRLIGLANVALPAHHRIQSLLPDLISYGRPTLEDAYLEINSNPNSGGIRAEIKGMEIVRIGDSFAMIPATIRGLDNTNFLATQYATGGAGILDTPITSDLSMSNSATFPITVTAQVKDAEGKIIPEGSDPVVITLAPHETLSGDAHEIFGFPPPAEDPDLHEGTLELQVDSKGLITDLLFGDARDGRYLTVEHLNIQQGRKFALGHFAEGLFGDPPKGLFTGIAIYNPNRNWATVTIEAFSAAGELLYRTNIPIARESRLAETVGQIFETTIQEGGGTITITSDLPIFVFEVFGSTESEFYVSVPPLILEP